MRIWFTLLLAACGSSSTRGAEGPSGTTQHTAATRADGPSPPEPRAYEAMSPDERCDATAVRAMPCVDELLVATMKQLVERGALDRRAMEAMKEEIARERSPAAEARALHRTNCAADDRYADAVAACWASEGCEALATCVASKTPVRGP